LSSASLKSGVVDAELHDVALEYGRQAPWRPARAGGGRRNARRRGRRHPGMEPVGEASASGSEHALTSDGQG